ncbi:DUF309 domain-containing protein [Mesorhizobium sp. M0644]|uniref:DUF309 domain-containing protein n=1 Tax=Mesorhizobium sp. M0644 TaxID=2956979 RepID=UPI00333553F8
MKIDLINHGYYWEAHEAWEPLWHAAKQSPQHRLLGIDPAGSGRGKDPRGKAGRCRAPCGKSWSAFSSGGASAEPAL